jgi:hypothetical protein
MRTATVAVNSAAPMAMSVISHPAIPPVATAWTTVGPGWDTADRAPTGDGSLPLAYDRRFTIKANAEGEKREKPNKLLQIARTTLAVRRTKWMCFMTTSLAMWNYSVWNYEQAQRRRAIR